MLKSKLVQATLVETATKKIFPENLEEEAAKIYGRKNLIKEAALIAIEKPETEQNVLAWVGNKRSVQELLEDTRQLAEENIAKPDFKYIVLRKVAKKIAYKGAKTLIMRADAYPVPIIKAISILYKIINFFELEIGYKILGTLEVWGIIHREEGEVLYWALLIPKRWRKDTNQEIYEKAWQRIKTTKGYIDPNDHK